MKSVRNIKVDTETIFLVIWPIKIEYYWPYDQNTNMSEVVDYRKVIDDIIASRGTRDIVCNLLSISDKRLMSPLVYKPIKSKYEDELVALLNKYSGDVQLMVAMLFLNLFVRSAKFITKVLMDLRIGVTEFVFEQRMILLMENPKLSDYESNKWMIDVIERLEVNVIIEILNIFESIRWELFIAKNNNVYHLRSGIEQEMISKLVSNNFRTKELFTAMNKDEQLSFKRKQIGLCKYPIADLKLALANATRQRMINSLIDKLKSFTKDDSLLETYMDLFSHRDYQPISDSIKDFVELLIYSELLRCVINRSIYYMLLFDMDNLELYVSRCISHHNSGKAFTYNYHKFMPFLMTLMYEIYIQYISRIKTFTESEQVYIQEMYRNPRICCVIFEITSDIRSWKLF